MPENQTTNVPPDRRLSVLWILNGCGMESGSITGGPVRFHEVSRRWQQAGEVEQALLTTAGGEGMLRRMGCTLPMHRVCAALVARRELFRVQRLWSYLLSAIHAPQVVRRLPPAEVVITASDYFCDIVPALAAKRRAPGCRWMAWIHHQELPPAQRPGNRLQNQLAWQMQQWSFRRIARSADQAWVLDSEAGDQVRAQLLSLGMPAERIRSMRNGIDQQAIDAVSEPAQKSVDAVMVGVRPNKGLHDIIPVWQEVQRLRPGTTLRLMGGMSGEQATLEEIRRGGLDRVIEVFRAPGGYLPPAEYYAKLKEGRVLFAPSHEEGWGIAVCEAMACRVPVVAWDLPVYRRIYGEALCAVPCFEHAAFAARLVGMLNDAAQYQQQVQAGRLRAERFAWDAIAREDAAATARML